MVRRRAARTAAVHHTAARAHRRAHAARPRQPREVAAPHSELCGVRGCARPLGALLPDPLELFGSVCSQINDEEIAEAEAFEEEMAGALEGMPSPDPSTRSSSPSEDGFVGRRMGRRSNAALLSEEDEEDEEDDEEPVPAPLGDRTNLPDARPRAGDSHKEDEIEVRRERLGWEVRLGG